MQEAVTEIKLPEFVETGFVNEFVRDIADEVYHADKTAANSSNLVSMMKSPAHWLHAHTFGKEPTEAMKFGTLAHMAILEGAKFKDRYVVTQEQLDNIVGMVESMLSHERASQLLTEGAAELAGYFRCPLTGIKSRFKMDFLAFKLNALLDVKTCADASHHAFSQQVVNLRYDFKMAMYAAGVEAITGHRPESQAWLAVETSAPYLVEVYEVSEEYQKTGRHDYEASMRQLKTCLDKKAFPKKNSDITVLQPPWWFTQDYQLKGVL